MYFFAVSCKILVVYPLFIDKFKGWSLCDDSKCRLHTCTQKHLWLKRKLHKSDRYRWPYMLTFSTQRLSTGLHQEVMKRVWRSTHFGAHLHKCWSVSFSCRCISFFVVVVVLTCSWLLRTLNPGVWLAGDLSPVILWTKHYTLTNLNQPWRLNTVKVFSNVLFWHWLLFLLLLEL